MRTIYHKMPWNSQGTQKKVKEWLTYSNTLNYVSREHDLTPGQDGFVSRPKTTLTDGTKANVYRQ